MASSQTSHTATSRGATVEIAGSAWPVFKLEALAAAFLTSLVLLVITGAPQTAVLSAAAIAALRWVVGVRRGG